jgi:hypothetical protein
MPTLNEVLKVTGDSCTRLNNGSVQVYIHYSRPYFGLSDYEVSKEWANAVSGPSLMMVPNHVHDWQPCGGGSGNGFYCSDCGDFCYG